MIQHSKKLVKSLYCLAFSPLARKKSASSLQPVPFNVAIQSGMLALVLLISEIMIVNHFIETNYFYANYFSFFKVYNILWWLIPAYIIDCGTRTVIWQYIESKTGLIIPKSVQKFISILIYTHWQFLESLLLYLIKKNNKLTCNIRDVCNDH